MIDIKFLSENRDLVEKKMELRGQSFAGLQEIIDLDLKRKKISFSIDNERSEAKKISTKIAKYKALKDKSQIEIDEENNLLNENSNLKNSIADNEKALAEIVDRINSKLAILPNLPDDSVPVGKSENDNVEIKRWGSIPNFSFLPLDHADLGEKLGLMDFESAATVTGSRFVFLKGGLARLERALINFMLDFHIQRGYTEINPPYIVNEKSGFGTGNLPKFKDDLFKIENTNWYLIPTAEVPLTNYVREKILSLDELPIKFVAFTPCFRSEAGSYGRDTKGLIRQHQFSKVEMVQIVAPDSSEAAHQEMVESACGILELLEIPYRQIILCTCDMGFSSAKTYDLEVWLPSQNKFREISSISNCSDFQARRAQIKYRNSAGKPEFVHTLNGSGLAVGRTLVAIMENFQQKDGSILVPKALRPYMDGRELITKYDNSKRG